MQDIWLPKDNPDVIAATFRIETLKYDIDKCEVEIYKVKMKIEELEIKNNLITRSLIFLKEEAKIVSISEYRKLIDKYKSIRSGLEYSQKVKAFFIAQKKGHMEELDRLNKHLSTLEFKLLEFPHDV